MSEQDWTTKPVLPATPEMEHTAVVDGLAIRIKERPSAPGGACTWTVQGFLADLHIYSYPSDSPGGYGVSLDDAKAAAVAAAHRLYAAGVRGEKSDPAEGGEGAG